MKLHQNKCVPCRGDIPPFTREQIDEYLKYLTDWKVLINEKKAFYLSRVYKFSNFEKSLGFINVYSCCLINFTTLNLILEICPSIISLIHTTIILNFQGLNFCC